MARSADGSLPMTTTGTHSDQEKANVSRKNSGSERTPSPSRYLSPTGSAGHERAAAAHSRLSAEASVVEEILWTESKFDGATPGSPEEFRAKEAADALRWKLEQLRSG